MRYILLLLIINISIFAKNTKIVFIQDNMANDFRKVQVLNIKEKLKIYKNIDFKYIDSKGKVSMFIYYLDKYIDENVDILILGCGDTQSVVSSLKKAYNKGIKVIILDRGVNSDKYTTYLSSNNIHIGEMAGEFLVKKLHQKGTILLLEGLPKADVTQKRTKGFFNIVNRYKDIKTITIIGNYLRRDTIIEVEKLFFKNIKFDAIFSQSDSMLSGVREVFKKYNKSIKDIVTIGVDYTKEAQKAIEDRNQTASIKFPLGAKEVVRVIERLISNKDVEKSIFLPIEFVNINNIYKIKPIF